MRFSTAAVIAMPLLRMSHLKPDAFFICPVCWLEGRRLERRRPRQRTRWTERGCCLTTAPASYREFRACERKTFA